MRTANVSRFYRVLVVGAVSLLGACDDRESDDSAGEPRHESFDSGLADAGEVIVDASVDCCPTACRADACVCRGEEIPCCWLVPHPLCEDLCEE